MVWGVRSGHAQPIRGQNGTPAEHSGEAKRESSTMSRAVVLLSGGLDSTTTFAVAKGEGFDVFALSVDYGQRHRIELDAAARVGLRRVGAGLAIRCANLRRA